MQPTISPAGEVDPLLAVAPAHHEGARAPVVLRPLEEIARREGGKSSREFHDLLPLCNPILACGVSPE